MVTKTTSTSSSKCGSCKKVVKEVDKTGIACDNCFTWYHGTCVGLSEQDVSTLGRISGCLWMCNACLDDNVFNSEAKYTSVITNQTVKNTMKNIQNTLDEMKATLKTPLEPGKSHETQSAISREIVITGLMEEKGDAHSLIEADNNKLQDVLKYLDNSNFNIENTRRLGQYKKESTGPRPLLVRFSSEWNVRKCLSRAYKLKNFPSKIFISNSLSKDDQATKRKLLEKRYQLISEGVPREELRIRELKLLRNGDEVEFPK